MRLFCDFQTPCTDIFGRCLFKIRLPNHLKCKWSFFVKMVNNLKTMILSDIIPQRWRFKSDAHHKNKTFGQFFYDLGELLCQQTWQIPISDFMTLWHSKISWSYCQNIFGGLWRSYQTLIRFLDKTNLPADTELWMSHA